MDARVAHVGLDREGLAAPVADALRDGLHALEIDVGDGDASALLGGEHADGLPEPPGAAGHEKALALQLHVVPLSP